LKVLDYFRDISKFLEIISKKVLDHLDGVYRMLTIQKVCCMAQPRRYQPATQETYGSEGDVGTGDDRSTAGSGENP
jgi:hypothetical protein